MESAITGRFRYKFRWIMTNLNLFRRIFDGNIWFSSIILSELIVTFSPNQCPFSPNFHDEFPNQVRLFPNFHNILRVPEY